MRVIKALLESYRQLMDVAPSLRKLDESAYDHLERALIEMAATVTVMRARGLMDPQSIEEFERIITSS